MQFYSISSLIALKYLLAGLAIIAGVFVISTKNAIISVFNLIVLYILVAFYLIYIGITYLGISYIIIVRRVKHVLHVMHICVVYSSEYNQYFHLITASELGNGESPKLNLASLSKVKMRKKQLFFSLLHVVSPMIKAILLKVNFPLALNRGHYLGCIVIITYLWDLKL